MIQKNGHSANCLYCINEQRINEFEAFLESADLDERQRERVSKLLEMVEKPEEAHV